MSSTDQIVEIPLPVRGLNTDAQEGPAGFTQDLLNYVPDGNTLRLRGGVGTSFRFDTSGFGSSETLPVYRTDGGTSTATAGQTFDWSTAAPIGVAQFDDRVLVTFMDNIATVVWSYTSPLRRWSSAPTGGPHRCMTVYYGPDTSGTYVWQAAPNVPPISGRGARIGARVFWVTPKLQGWQKGGYTGTWAGARPFAGVTASVTSVAAGAEFMNVPTVPAGAQAYYDPSLASYDPYLIGRDMTGTGTSHQFIYTLRPEGQAYSGTNFKLYFGGDIFGRGIPQTIGAMTSVLMEAAGYVWTTPEGSDACESHLERMFFAGVFKQPTYTATLPAFRERPNRVWFSEAGNPDYFPDDNYFDLPTSYPVVAMQSLGDTMLIHTIKESWVLRGYDGDNYAVSRLGSGEGCVGKMANYVSDGTAYWWSPDGIQAWSGRGNVTNLSQFNSSTGVTRLLKERISEGVSPAGLSGMSPSVFTSGDTSVVASPKNDVASTFDIFMRGQPVLNRASPAWWQWSVGYSPSSTLPYRWYPWFYYRNPVTGAVYGVTRNQVMGVNGLFTTPGNSVDTLYTFTPGTVSDNLEPAVEALTSAPATALLGPIYPRRGHQVRLSGVEVDFWSTRPHIISASNSFTVEMTSDPKSGFVAGALLDGETYADSVNFVTGVDNPLRTTRFTLGASTFDPDASRFYLRVNRTSAMLSRHGIKAVYVRLTGVTREQRAY